MKNKFRVNVYIDGFNFYYGLKSKSWKKYYWLDIVKLYEQFMRSNQQLNNVFYCTASTANPSQKRRQDAFFQANNLNEKFILVFGKFLEKEVSLGGKNYRTFEEKQTNVNIAINFIRNIIFDNCDSSIIVSADSDLLPAINLAREINPNHKIFIHFPPGRHSSQLENCSDGIIRLHRYENYFKKALLPNEIRVGKNLEYIINRPSTWY